MEEIEKTFGATAQVWQKYFSRIWTDPELYQQWWSPEFKSPENRPHPELSAAIDAIISTQLFPNQLSRFHNALHVLNSVMPVTVRIFRVNDELYNLIRSAEIDGCSARERCFQVGKAQFRANESLSEVEKRQLAKTPYAAKSREEETIFYDQMSYHMMNHWNRTVCLEKVKQTTFSDAHLSSVNLNFGFLAVVNECLGLAEQEGRQPNTSFVIATFLMYGATALGLPSPVLSRKNGGQGILFVYVKRVPNLAVMLAQLTRRLERALSNYYEPDASATDLNPLIRPTATFNADKASCQVELRDKTGKSVVFVVEILFSVPDAICHPDFGLLPKKETASIFEDSLNFNALYILREYFLLKHIVRKPDMRFSVSLVLGLRSESASLRCQVSSWDVVMIMWTLSQLAPLENPGVAMTRFFAVVEQGRVCKSRSPTAPFSALPMAATSAGPHSSFNVENFAVLNCDADKIPATTANVVSDDTGVLNAIFRKSNKNMEIILGVEMTLEQKRQWGADQASIRKYVLQKMIGIPPPNQPPVPVQSTERRARSRSPRSTRDRGYHSDDRRPDRYRDHDQNRNNSNFNHNDRYRGRSFSGVRGRQEREGQYDRRERSRERQEERRERSRERLDQGQNVQYERSRERSDEKRERSRERADQYERSRERLGQEEQYDRRERSREREEPRREEVQVQTQNSQSSNNSSGEDSGVDSQRNSPEDEHNSFMPIVHNYLGDDAVMYQPMEYGQPEQVVKDQESMMEVAQEPVTVNESADVDMVGEVTPPASQQPSVETRAPTVEVSKNNDAEIRKDGHSKFEKFFSPRKDTESTARAQLKSPTVQQGEKRHSLEAFGFSDNGRPAKQLFSPPQPTGGPPAPAERFTSRPNGMKYGQAQPSGASGNRRPQGSSSQDLVPQPSPPTEARNPLGTTLYVIEQRRGTSEEDVATLFSQFGEVVKVYSRPSGWHYNTDYAYVTYRHAADASNALAYILEKELILKGRSLLLAPDHNKEAKDILINSPNARGRFDVCLRGLPLCGSVSVKILMEYLTARVNRNICHELDDIRVQKGKGYALMSFKEAWRAENFLQTFHNKPLVLDDGLQAEVIIAPLSLRFDPTRPKPTPYPLKRAMCELEVAQVG